MFGAVLETASPRRQFEKRKYLPERSVNIIKLYTVNQRLLDCTKPSSTGPTGHTQKRSSVKLKREESTVNSGGDSVTESQLLKDLTENLVSFKEEEDDAETPGNKADSLEAAGQSAAGGYPSCTYLITVIVQACDVSMTSLELLGFITTNVMPKHSDHSYLFTSNEDVVHKMSEKTSESKRTNSTPRNALKVSFRKCPHNFHCTSPVYSEECNYLSLFSREKESKSNKTLEVSPNIKLNEEVLANLIRMTLVDFSGNPNNYKSVELSAGVNDILCNFPCFSIDKGSSDRQKQLQNTSFTDALFSFLTWPMNSSTSAYELAINGFARDDVDGEHVICLSCGMGLNVTEFKGNNISHACRENNQECKSFKVFVSSTKTEENFTSKQERERDCDPNDDEEEENHSTRRTPSRSDSLEHMVSLWTMENTSLDNSVQTLSSEHLFPVDDTDATSSNQQPNSLERPESQTEVVEYTQSAHSDVTSEVNLIDIASGGVDRLTYPPRNPRYVSPESRRLSFSTWIRAQDAIDNLVDSGFFFTGEDDVVRCYQCDIGLAEWNPGDDPWVEHARHSPDCPYLRSRKDDPFINNIQLQWAKIYTPKHSCMTSPAKRKESFDNSWPTDFVLQTPDQLAEAGFFYTGSTDTVRCHYCDGGLREWEPEDDPWTEHARWFPFCKFVIKVKGLQFIQDSAAPENLPDDDVDDVPQAVAQRTDFAPSFLDKCRQRELKNPMFSAAAESALAIGYSKETVKDAIMIYIERTGNRDFSAPDLVDIVFELEEQGRAFFSEEVDTVSEEDEFQLTPKAMERENLYLKEKLKCVKCKEKERCMLFIPCGHRITCGICSKQQKICPTCLAEVTSTVKTFLG